MFPVELIPITYYYETMKKKPLLLSILLTLLAVAFILPPTACRDKIHPRVRAKKIDLYITLGLFYTIAGNKSKAETMYLQVIESEPQNPVGYRYYANFLFERRKWDDAVPVLERRLYTFLDPTIIPVIREIKTLKTNIIEVEAILKNINTIKKHRKLTQKYRTRLLKEAVQRLRSFLPLSEMHSRLIILEPLLEKKINTAETGVLSLSPHRKQFYAEVYCELGEVHWYSAHYLPSSWGSSMVKEKLINSGMSYLKKACRLAPRYPVPYLYMALLYREKIECEPMKSEKYQRISEEDYKRFCECIIPFTLYKTKTGKEEEPAHLSSSPINKSE